MRLKKLLASLAATLLVTTGLAVSSASPASADGLSCRSAYTANGWYAYPCVYSDGLYFDAYGVMTSYPSNCSTYRVYLVDNWGDEVLSTSARNCSETVSPWVGEVYHSDMGNYALARLKAYNSSGSVNSQHRQPVSLLRLVLQRHLASALGMARA